MAYRLSNECTKNYCNRTIHVQVIVKDVETYLFYETQCRAGASIMGGGHAIHRAHPIFGLFGSFDVAYSWTCAVCRKCNSTSTSLCRPIVDYNAIYIA